MNFDDINKIDQRFGVKIELISKNNESEDDAKLRRFKDKWLFILTLVGIAVVYGACIGFLIVVRNQNLQGITLNGIIGLTMALAGYYVRGKN